jgi:hypothetical protein
MISDISPSSYVEHSIIYPSCRSYIRHHMVIAQENKCAMCGKDTVGRGRLDNYNKENERKQQQENKFAAEIDTHIQKTLRCFDQCLQ